MSRMANAGLGEIRQNIETLRDGYGAMQDVDRMRADITVGNLAEIIDTLLALQERVDRLENSHGEA